MGNLNKSTDFFPDNALKRRLLGLHVRCKNREEGCDWIGELRAVKNHIKKICKFVFKQCPLVCGKRVKRHQIESHVQNECQLRSVKCEHCRKEVKYLLMKNHTPVCPRFPVSCVFQCGQTLPREEMKVHVDKQGTCPTALLKCDCREVGCEFKGTRSELEEHYRANVHKHLMLAMVEVRKEKERVRNLESNFTSSQSSLATTKEDKEKIRSLELQLETVRRSLTTTRQELMEMKQFVYVWKIDSLSRQSKQSQINSSSFYTGKPGYKLHLRFYPNKGQSHAGLYLNIDRGDYDSLLQWPFSHCFTMSVLEQKVNGKHISYRVAAPGGSLATPGTFCGSRKFISKEVLSQECYTKNDTLFIKLVVDMND
ncbi:TNF receptor-associated factor 5-like [Corticium candelabrum]|uniref:TNF receptor-associated factor 5-like n=1 Tax=Corticium candelabrum TaxID=121492 RepID=UPI002E25D43A|nr:TNF receptor-associated factor 5-like [Corticium candelabrum]